MPARSLWASGWLLIMLAVPSWLQGQAGGGPDSKQASTIQAIDGKLVDQLPVDRIRDALVLLPGVGANESSGVSIRGGSSSDVAAYLDGIPVSPGFRKSSLVFDPTFLPVPGQSFLDLGTNALATLEAATGPLSSSLGQGQAGVILLTTLVPDRRFQARGSVESDRPFGSGHGPGIDRLQGIAGGRLMDRLRVLATATVQGSESRESGPGALDIPIFTTAGLDTVVAVPTVPNDPFSDTVFVDVTRFAIERGRCDALSSSANPDIADNYGEECNGIRVPATGSSSYQLLGKLEYELGARTAVWLTGVASRSQFRYFEPSVSSIPGAGNKATSRAVIVGVRHGLNFSGRPLALSLGISSQRDQTIGGPLSPPSELDTRDGFLFSGLEFLYDMESFPIDDQLISNIRNNIPGSRRSPLDLENTSQYNLVDRFRNSPYGLGGGPESGGPSGRLLMLKEDRTVIVGSAEWQRTRSHTFRTGFEVTRYDIAGYSHQLNSQAFSDAFIVEPTQAAFFAENQFRLGSIAVVAGVRYDRFQSDAERPFALDTVGSSPHFMTYSYFPVTASYGNGGITFNGQPLVKFVKDDTKDAVSPRIKLAFAPLRSTVVRLGVARQNQMPDLSLVLSGINTDIRVTNTSHVYGSDLDMLRTTLYEIGVRHSFSSRLTFDASLYTRDLDDQPVPRLVSHRDPSRTGEELDIRRLTSLGIGRVTGVDARVDLQVGLLRGSVGYAFQDANQNNLQLADSRPHALTGAWALEVPSDWGGGLAGSILRNSGVYGTFRFASGTAYTRCAAQSGNESVLAGQPCIGGFDGDLMGSRLPSTRHLDLRISRGFRIAGRELVAYIDGRNVLSFENTLRVYAVNGRTSNPIEAQQVFSVDSIGFANIGFANGIYGGQGELDLSYGGAAAGGCASFVNAVGQPAAPDCVYLIRAEERFGDGDHIFTVAEQRAASDAAYQTVRGRSTFLGPPRRLRLGLEVRF